MIRKFKVYLSTISLSFFGISNFFDNIIGDMYFILGFILLMLITLNIIFNFNDFKISLDKILTQVIFPSFFLSYISFSAIIEVFNVNLGYIIWVITAVLYFAFAIYFIYRNVVRKFSLKNVIPGWFLVFVGLGNMAIVTPQHNNYLFGQIIFYFSLLIYIFLLLLLCYRLKKVGNIDESIRPSYMLLIAGPSVNLVGYFNVFSVDSYNYLIIYGLITLSLLITFLLIINYKKVFVNRFYPSFVSYTFPVIITTTMYIEIINNLQMSQFTNSIIILKVCATMFVSIMSGYILLKLRYEN